MAEWVDLPNRKCRLALAGKRPVRLDLSAVTFIDGRGVEAVRRLAAKGLAIINCPEFIRELLRTP